MQALFLTEDEFRSQRAGKAGLRKGSEQELRHVLCSFATVRSIGQQACLLDRRMPSLSAVAAAHRITERQQTNRVGEAKMGSTQITGPTLLAGKRHLSLQIRRRGWGTRPIQCDTAKTGER